MIKRLLPLIAFLCLFANLTQVSAQSGWCYLINFRLSDYFFIVSAGSYVAGNGFKTNTDGRVAISYINSAPVSIGSVQMTFTRGSAVTGDIHMSAFGNIFGLNTGAFTPAWLAVADQVGMSIAQNNVTPGTALSFLADSDKEILVTSMQLGGTGSNPFGSDNCANGLNPTPAPTSIGIPAGDILSGLSLADQQFASVDTSLTAPNGIPLLPLENGVQIMTYAKWLTSYQAAQKITGPFAPLIASAGIYIAMRMVLIGIWGTVYIGTYMWTWLVWVFRLILAIIQALLSALSSIVSGLLSFIGL